MFDALLTILLFNFNWIKNFNYVAFSGFPLIFLSFYVGWNLQIFPTTMYNTYDISMRKIFFMLVLLDILQTMCHWVAHKPLKNSLFGKSHQIHHKNRNPDAEDAFYTGIVDAYFQLILPLVLTLHISEPSRCTAILFGCFYSWWLLFLHSSQTEYPLLKAVGIVTPKYHYEHHQNPNIHFSNLFAFL